jgi:hypothetical protein
MTPTDYPLTPCDFKKWTRYESVPIEQACFVLLGYEPPSIQVLRFRPVQYQERPGKTWEKPPGFDDMLALLESSIKADKVAFLERFEHSYMTKHVEWPVLVSWAESKDCAVPPALLSVRAATSVSVSKEPPSESETPVQRRARWLKWWGKGERGALQAVYERELLQNPKADRSYIGKQIKIAEQEATEAKRGGLFVSQLVQDGKRKG